MATGAPTMQSFVVEIIMVWGLRGGGGGGGETAKQSLGFCCSFLEMMHDARNCEVRSSNSRSFLGFYIRVEVVHGKKSY